MHAGNRCPYDIVDARAADERADGEWMRTLAVLYSCSVSAPSGRKPKSVPDFVAAGS
jgi:hypothetical protein